MGKVLQKLSNEMNFMIISLFIIVVFVVTTTTSTTTILFIIVLWYWTLREGDNNIKWAEDYKIVMTTESRVGLTLLTAFFDFVAP